MSNHQDTICAIATPSGEGAIAIIRLSGADSLDIISKLFSKNLKDKKSHTVHFGVLKSADQVIIDEVLITVFHKGESYTGEESIEIACHASRFIEREILATLVKVGCRIAQPGEFTQRAFLNGKLDLSQAEAVADLIASESRASHGIALKQMRGGFSSELKDLRQKLMDFASLFELELDFGEEDVEFADRSKLEELVTEILLNIERLERSFELGNAIKNGVSVVIAGVPNVGKSTLFNGLLNEERAIVSDIEGTTRDAIEERVNIKGIEFRLIDTAGIREAQDAIEKIGVARTFSKINESSLLIYMFDQNDLSSNSTAELDKLDFPKERIVLLANKNDMTSDNTKLQAGAFSISAQNQNDIEIVKEELYKKVVQNEEMLEGTIVTNARHFQALLASKKDLEEVKKGLASNISGDLLAMDIRSALNHLGEITGQVTSDDLLGNIFSRFCIGK